MPGREVLLQSDPRSKRRAKGNAANDATASYQSKASVKEPSTPVEGDFIHTTPSQAKKRGRWNAANSTSPVPVHANIQPGPQPVAAEDGHETSQPFKRPKIDQQESQTHSKYVRLMPQKSQDVLKMKFVKVQENREEITDGNDDTYIESSAGEGKEGFGRKLAETHKQVRLAFAI